MTRFFTCTVLHRFLLVCLFPAITAAQPCTDLFISEYVEGSSFNKVIEIYNPTTGTIAMDGYQLLLYSNGATSPSFSFKLHGLIESHDVYLISHPQADSVQVLTLADTTGLVCNWNGDDAIALVNNNTGDTIDIIGMIGVDPGTSWTVPGGTTADHTLVRTMETQEGTLDWSTGSQQWTSYIQNDFSHLGNHEILTCPAASPEISLSVDSSSIQEGAGSFHLKISILNPNSAATSGDLKVTGGNATQGSDYLFTDQTITFPANAFEPIEIAVALVNDGLVEPDESVEITLQNPTNGATIGAELVVVKIIDDDALSGAALPDPRVEVFPNPVKEVLFVDGGMTLQRVEVENLHGTRVLDRSTDGKQRIELPFYEMAAGIYVLTMYCNDQIVRKHIVKID